MNLFCLTRSFLRNLKRQATKRRKRRKRRKGDQFEQIKALMLFVRFRG